MFNFVKNIAVKPVVQDIAVTAVKSAIICSMAATTYVIATKKLIADQLTNLAENIRPEEEKKE